MGVHSLVRRARRGVALDGGVQGGAGGGKGVSGDPAGAGRRVRRRGTSSRDGKQRVETRYGVTAVGAHALPLACMLRPHVLCGETVRRCFRRASRE